MDSIGNRSYDYLITDSKGTRKVINGIEYPVTKDDLPKPHQDKLKVKPNETIPRDLEY